MPTCKECGFVTNYLSWKHLKSHGMTTKQYKEKHPGARFLSKAGRRKRVEDVKKIWARRSAEERQRICKGIIESEIPPEAEARRRRKISEFHANRTEEERAEISEKCRVATIAGMAKMTEEQIEKRKDKLAETWGGKTPEELQEFRKAISDGWKNQDDEQKAIIKKRKAKATKKVWSGYTDLQKERRGVKISEAWKAKTPEEQVAIRRKVALAACAAPNYMEKYLRDLLKPYGFRYVGDWTHHIRDKKGLMNVDFIRDGDKAVVELYGDRYHNENEWPIRKARLESCGYKAAMVWASELKRTPKKALRKIFRELEASDE